jgi:dTDP-4-amino-4,6-dideoxygalactose transaminase
MAKLALLGGEKVVTLSPGPWPRLGDEEVNAVCDAANKARTDGRYLCSAGGETPVKEFEELFARTMGAQWAMTTCGCGPALHIAMMAAGVQAGDEVIVSPYSWGQTVSCILHQNAIPVFADIEPFTYTLDPGSVEQRVTPNTKAIVVVHIYGHPADMDGINAVAKRHGLKVVEDCAQATGAIYKGRRVGVLGNLGCFSIGDGKNVIGGEGGLLLTSDERLWKLANLMGQHPARHGRVVAGDPELEPYVDSLIYTYRIHPFTCVIAGVQLPHMDEWNAERRRNADRLSQGLKEIPGISAPHVAPGCEHVYHIYSPSFVPDDIEGISRETFVKAVAAEGVPIGMGYVRNPIHLRRWMQERNYFYGKGCPWTCAHAKREVRYSKGDCPVAERRCEEEELTIGGSTAWLGDESKMIDQYLDAFRKVAENLEALRAFGAGQAQ